MINMKMDLFVFPASLILLLALFRIKKKTFRNSIFVISNNVIAGNSKTTVFCILFAKLERNSLNNSKTGNMKV